MNHMPIASLGKACGAKLEARVRKYSGTDQRAEC